MKLNVKLGQNIKNLFKGKKDKQRIISEVEEVLISSDFGIDFTSDIINELEKADSKDDRDKFVEELKTIIKKKMIIENPKLSNNTLNIHLLFGVNGTGKTTTVGKLAYKLKEENRKVLICAADTYRDAAIEQLMIWGKRADVPMIRQHQGSDPGAVVFDACDAARSKKVNDLVIDTAGRLHNKERLMGELAKISRIVEKKLPDAKKIKLLVIDATTGQNAITQASLFNEYIGVDGIILTKLDSSAKGGVACSISGKLKIPILFVGIGEKIEDLINFNVDKYLDAMFV